MYLCIACPFHTVCVCILCLDIWVAGDSSCLGCSFVNHQGTLGAESEGTDKAREGKEQLSDHTWQTGVATKPAKELVMYIFLYLICISKYIIEWESNNLNIHGNA